MFSFFRKMRGARPRCAALVAAAGSARRMGGINKLLEPLDGVPVLVRTLTALEQAELVDEIVVATREEDLMEISRLCRDYGIHKCTKVVRGGETGSVPYCWRRWKPRRRRSFWQCRTAPAPW